MLRIHYAIEYRKKQDFFKKNKENIKKYKILDNSIGKCYYTKV